MAMPMAAVMLMPGMSIIRVTNNNTQYCTKYHGADPTVSMAMATTRLCDSRTKHHCCGGTPNQKFLHKSSSLFIISYSTILKGICQYLLEEN
jgi:hypothetical protein